MLAANTGAVTEPTELLITAYDGEKPLFTTCLAPGKASTVLTVSSDDGTPTVEEIVERPTRLFEPVKQMLVDLATPVNVA